MKYYSLHTPSIGTHDWARAWVGWEGIDINTNEATPAAVHNGKNYINPLKGAIAGICDRFRLFYIIRLKKKMSD